MSLNKKEVTVLCPNGRRVNIKSTSSTSIGQIIEEACLKQKLDPLNYNLKHLKRILDPSNTLQYSNIPNHAQLELVEAVKRRKELNVIVNLVTEDGQRLIHEFSSSSTLWDVLSYHDSVEGNNFSLPTPSSNIAPFIVYTMRKLSGEDLKSVTLKSLGLYGGKCMIRYNTQAKEIESPEMVSLSPIVIINKTAQAKPKPTCDTEEPSSEVDAMDCDTTEIEKDTSMEESSSKEIEETKGLELQNSTFSNTSQKEESDKNLSETEEIRCYNLVSEIGSSEINQVDNSVTIIETKSDEIECESNQEVLTSKEEDIISGLTKNLDKPQETHVSSGHNWILFSLEDAPPAQVVEENDSFFELTTGEVRKLYTEKVAMRKELEDAALMTNQLRELEKSKQILSAMNQFPITQLRIIFPDNLVIQANFKPFNTVKDVMNFLKPLLIRSDLNFYLYTTCPKRIVDPESQLVHAGFVPKACVRFGTEEEIFPPYLSKETLSKKSTFEAASKSVIKSRVQHSSDELSSESSTSSLPENKSSKSRSEDQSAKVKSSQTPKWFKLGK